MARPANEMSRGIACLLSGLAQNHGAQAREDFENYITLAPNARDGAAVREQLVALTKRATLIH